MAAPSGAPKIGSVLEGKYRLDGILGEGGMGRVFRGIHIGINRPVAIKVLHPRIARDAASALRFQQEAMASGQLDHPNIVGVSDVGVLADGEFFLVMELLEGETLGDRLARDRVVPWRDAIGILRETLAGLQHAHDRGVVHCDVKPDNVFLARKHGELVVKLLDFGVAQSFSERATTGELGLPIIGTPAYVSPEQARGNSLGPETDVYSASVVAYQMLCGAVPFTGRDARAVLHAHAETPPPPFPAELGIPPAFEQIIRHGLEKPIENRIASGSEYIEHLDQLARDSDIEVKPSTSSIAAPRGYDFLQSIGRGGMAEVFLARQSGLMGFEKLVVIKKIHAHLATKPHLVEMFLDEARLAARINDPHVVQIYELGETNGNYFIAMEYLVGESLDAIVASAATGRSAPSPQLVARIIADAAAGLHAAHELRDAKGQLLDLVHRDVSQANIVVLYSGAVKVVDFGIAKARSQLASNRGTSHGKPGYLSPEQVDGREIDRRSDVFSLGVVLWEALTCRHLFAGQTDAETLERIRRGVAPPPSALAPVPAELDRIVAKALAKDPRDRYQTAEAMRIELEAFLRESGLPSGALELAAYMTSTFPDRIEQRARLVEAAARDAAELPVVARITDAANRHPPTTLLARRRRSFAPIAIATTVCAIAVVGWLIGHHGNASAALAAHATAIAPPPVDAPAPAAPLVADPVFDEIDHAIATGHLATPSKASALELLDRADARYPGDPRAKQLRERAVDVLRTSAQILWSHDKQDSARAVYADLLRFVPGDTIAKARSSVRAVRAAAPANVEWLVSQIDLAIIERRLVAPPGHNALEYL
ncbi:MAG TPA: serine/threonine-protein kinase, partial [Kofleriaceae bacterium]